MSPVVWIYKEEINKISVTDLMQNLFNNNQNASNGLNPDQYHGRLLLMSLY